MVKIVKVRDDLLQKYNNYSDLIGVPAAKIIEEALRDYLDTAVEAHYDVIQKRNARS
jgi:hypothetical protein